MFRNIAIVITAVIDMLFFGTKFNCRCITALVLVVVGSLVYTGFDVNYDPTGYMWLSLNTFLCVVTAPTCLSCLSSILPLLRRIRAC